MRFAKILVVEVTVDARVESVFQQASERLMANDEYGQWYI